MKCDLCGEKEASLIINVEGTEMSACKQCSNLGKTIKPIRTHHPEKKQQSPAFRPQTAVSTEPVEIIVKNFGQIVQKARESRGLKQEELAKKLHEKESVLHAIESGRREPRLELARKLEKQLNIKLVELYEEKTARYGKSDAQFMTIGDIIKKKR